jgi:hypothetical protein
MKYKHIVKPVYKGHSREPEIVPFIYRLKLDALFNNGNYRTALQIGFDCIPNSIS